MIMMFALTLLLAALGMPIYCLLDNIPMIEMPKFIGCLFAGAIARNVMEAAGIKFYVPEVDAIEHMFLELYLALVLMTTDFTKLAPVAGQMSIILIAQGIFMALFGIFVSFNLFGRDYGAAVMTAGNIGWGCGSGSNAVANEKALMDQYGWHNIAWRLPGAEGFRAPAGPDRGSIRFIKNPDDRNCRQRRDHVPGGKSDLRGR